jgi:hypothetical protein
MESRTVVAVATAGWGTGLSPVMSEHIVMYVHILLEVEAGTPALRIVRHYIDPAGEAFEISVTIHPADRFTFSIRLRRNRE